jgi:hypothetical protein
MKIGTQHPDFHGKELAPNTAVEFADNRHAPAVANDSYGADLRGSH